MEASLSKEKTESVDVEGKKTTYILNPLAPEFVPRARLKIVLPVEVLVKIFNFLPNQDIRCGVSMTCKKFNEICQDESLVPVKDLVIHGDKQLSYDIYLRDFVVVSDIIVRSKKLTSLKIKALNLETAKQLVRIALQECPKLIHLEIVETLAQAIADHAKGKGE